MHFRAQKSINKQWESLSNRFPLSVEALNYYVGPNTSRERHHIFAWPDYFENGFAELFSRVALCYDAELNECDLL